MVVRGEGRVGDEEWEGGHFDNYGGERSILDSEIETADEKNHIRSFHQESDHFKS